MEMRHKDSRFLTACSFFITQNEIYKRFYACFVPQ